MSTSEEMEAIKSKEHNAQIEAKYRELLGKKTEGTKEEKPVSTPRLADSYVDMDRALYHKEGLSSDIFTIPDEFGEQTLEDRQTAYKAAMAAMAQSVASSNGATEASTGKREKTMLDTPAYKEAVYRMASAAASEYIDNEVTAPSYADPSAIEGTGVRAMVRERGENKVQSADAVRVQRLIAFFAVAFLLVLAIIAFNSAVLNGMTVEVNALQGRLVEIQNTITELQQQIDIETDLTGILEYARQAGMVLGL